MAKLDIKKATTDVTLYVFVQNSSVTTGAGLTGLVYNSAGLVCYQVRPLAAAAAVTLATQTVTGAHSDGGFVEVDATNMPGVYRLDLTDAVCATGVNSVVVMLKGATNMVPVVIEIELVSYDPNDAVRAGLTSLPNAAAEAAGGLYTRGTGSGQINQPANGQVDVNVEKWNATNVPAEHTAGYPIVTVKDGTGTGEIDTNAGAVVSVTTVGTLTTYTGNTPQTGDSFARLGAPAGASVSVDIAAVKAETASIQSDTNDIQTRLPAALVGGRLPADLQSIDGQITTGNNATLNLKKLDIRNSAGNAVDIRMTGGAEQAAVYIKNEVIGKIGLYVTTSGGSSTGVKFEGNGNADLDALLGNVGNVTGDVWGSVQADVLGSVGSLGATAKTDVITAVWTTAATRTLTSFGTLVNDIWATLTSGLTTVGSIGKLIVDNLNATISSRSSHSAADVWASGTRTLTSFGTLTTDTATAVWASGTRTLTSFGTLVADTAAAVWASVTRTLTAASDSSGVTTLLTRISAAITFTGGWVDANLKTWVGSVPGGLTPGGAVDANIVEVDDQTTANSITGLLDVSVRVLQASTVDSSAVAASGANKIADALLSRDMSLVTGVALNDRRVLNALRALRNKVTIVGTTLTVYAEDDVTVAWTTTITTDAAALPITASDPA